MRRPGRASRRGALGAELPGPPHHTAFHRSHHAHPPDRSDHPGAQPAATRTRRRRPGQHRSPAHSRQRQPRPSPRRGVLRRVVRRQQFALRVAPQEGYGAAMNPQRVSRPWPDPSPAGNPASSPSHTPPRGHRLRRPGHQGGADPGPAQLPPGSVAGHIANDCTIRAPAGLTASHRVRPLRSAADDNSRSLTQHRGRVNAEPVRKRRPKPHRRCQACDPYDVVIGGRSGLTRGWSAVCFSVMTMVMPPPGVSSAVSVPPIASAKPRATARPRPTPAPRGASP